MANTESNMLPLGTKAPHFTLYDTVSENMYSLDELKGDKGTVVMFICNHCPFVKHVNKEISRMAKQYTPVGIKFIAISSNDVENYPDDAPDKMKENAKEQDFIFPYLYDESQEVAKAFDAACTPDFYVFNDRMELIYRGQLDSSRPQNDLPVTGKDLRTAINSLLTGIPLKIDQKPSIGCNIKWKK
ncbi:Peroxiredoxin [Zhouia amylolytica]|uniref:Peroxiredoxin n=1 Tax=Zhouia amylolytica TaxID=376730 RepID=A0A1I6RSX0_9FLAO|nr:thioredoxin family protein [Zhouia amylolytica]MCQ0111910.1 thioredoxin family protein [Zhouia amylolytica]SFS67817.1 Peroxiredoxin [Zhouia amylolytica]